MEPKMQHILSHIDFQSMFHAMKSGFIYGQVVTDSFGKPIDFRILQVNSAFERITSLQAKDVLNKSILEVDSTLSHDTFSWIEVCGNVAITTESIEVEFFSSHFTMWLHMQVFSPKTGFFVSILEDITRRKTIEIENTSNERRLHALIRVLQYQHDDISSLMNNALHEAVKITESTMGYVYLFNNKTQKFDGRFFSHVLSKKEQVPATTEFDIAKDTMILQNVIHDKQSIFDNHYNESTLHISEPPQEHIIISRYLAVPVFFAEQIVAVVVVANKQEDYTTTDELQVRLLMDGVWHIVENKKARQEVEYEKTIQHNLAESLSNSPLGMMYWKYHDGVATVLEWNRTAEKIFGWNSEEMVGHNFLDKLYYPDDIENSHRRIQTLQKTTESYHFQNKCYTKNNQLLTIKWFVSYIKKDDDQTIYGMSLAENLTEIEQAKQNVELIKKQFEYALEGSRAGSWDWYIAIDELYVNNRWLEIVGFDEHQIQALGFVSKMDFWLHSIHPADIELYKKELHKHLAKETDYYHCEYRILCKKKQWIWIEDRGKITQTSDSGKPTRMSGTIQDITYQKEIFHELEIRNELSSAFLEKPGTSIFARILQTILRVTGSEDGVIGYFGENETCHIAAIPNQPFQNTYHPLPINLHKREWGKTVWGKFLLKKEKTSSLPLKFSLLPGYKTFARSIITPIYHKEELVGFFIVEDTSKYPPSSTRKIVQIIATRMSPLFYSRLQTILNEEKRYVAEQNLIASEEKLEIALDASNIGSWEWQMEKDLLTFDSRCIRMLGYTEEEFKKKGISRWNQVIHPNDMDKNDSDYRHYYYGSKPHHGVDVRMVHQSGSHIWVSKRGKFTQHDLEGKPVQMNGTITEITKLKNAQLETKSQKDELEWLSLGHQELLKKITASSLFQYIADSLSKKIPNSLLFVLESSLDQKTLHMKSVSTTSKSMKEKILQWVIPQMSQYSIRVTDDYQPILASKTLFEVPKSLLLHSMGFFSKTITRFLNHVIGVKKMHMIGLTGNKGHLGSVILVQHEDTPLPNVKTIESFVYKASLVLERILLETEEKASKIRLEQVTEHAKSIIWETDTDAKILFISPYVKELLGYSPEELIQSKSWYELHTNSEIDRMKDLFERKIQQGKPFKNIFTELKKKDGSILYVSSNAVPILNNETVIGFRGVDYDITLLKNIDQAKNEFINTVSHEMRTPLTVLKEANLILEMGALNDQQKSVLQISKKNVDRLARIINNVLDYQKLQARKVVLSYETIDLREFLDDIYESYIVVANKKNIQLETQIRTKNPFLTIDEDKLYEVVGNLLDNAIKYTETGFVHIKVQDANSKTLRFIVADTGTGIDKNEIPKLFKVFSQTSTVHSRRSGSTGLGLAICKEIVELFQGSIQVESKVGEGTTFLIDIPRR
jgi:PAS domain S-box-containing protein